MKRVAVCLYGRFGNRFDENAGDEGIRYLLNSVISGTQADIFVYSFDTEHASQIIESLGDRLTDCTFLEAPDLLNDFVQGGGDLGLFELEDGSRGIEGTLSFVAQRDGAIQLMSAWAHDKGVSYDSVFVSRIDLGQIDKHNQRFPQRVSEAPSIQGLRTQHSVYHAAWNQLNEGLPDQWFFLDKSDAVSLGCSLERFMRYLQPNSDYLRWCATGIDYSNRADQFSNEQTALESRAEKSTRLPSRALDNHLLHKFDFLQTGLFGKLQPAFDSHEIAHLTYTHSSYLDGYVLSHSQQRRHLGEFRFEYLAIESGFSSESIPPSVRILPYDDSLDYTDRLRSVVDRMDEEYVFFTHEDMPLLRTPVIEAVLSARDLLQSHEKNSVVRMIRVGRGLRLNLQKPSRAPYFQRIHYSSPWLFSIQPSLWKRPALLALLNECQGLSVWDFEVKGQRAFRRLGFRGFQPLTTGVRRGRHHFDSLVYPYVATAIVKGKWNTVEYPELSLLLDTVDLSAFKDRNSLT